MTAFLKTNTCPHHEQEVYLGKELYATYAKTVDHNRNESWEIHALGLKEWQDWTQKWKSKDSGRFEGTLLEFLITWNKPELKPFQKQKKSLLILNNPCHNKINVDKLFSYSQKQSLRSEEQRLWEKRRVQNTVKEQQMDLALVCFMFQYQI
jgi:hypothetical protein